MDPFADSAAPATQSRFRFTRPQIPNVRAPLETFQNIRAEKGRKWKIFLTYATDWIITLGFTVAFFFLDKFVEGFKREFDLTDTS